MNPPLNIGIICHHTVGGSTKVALRLADALAAQEHQISLFSLYTPLLYTPKTNVTLYTLPNSEASVNFHSSLFLDWPNDLYSRFKTLLIETIKKKEISILHAHYGIPFAKLLWDIKAALPHAPLSTIVTLHGSDVNDEKIRHQFGADLCFYLGKMNHLSTVSYSHASLCNKYYQLQKIKVIPNFVEKVSYHSLNHPSKKYPVMIHISNFRPVKQASLAIEILKEVIQEIPAQLVMVGEGPEFRQVKALVEKLRLERWVQFIGFHKNPVELLLDADLFLSTSKAESFGLAALEAMACGVPIVVPFLGGFVELIEHGKQGFFYGPQDISQAAKSIITLLSDPEMHQQMASQALARSHDFDPEQITQKYLALYSHSHFF